MEARAITDVADALDDGFVQALDLLAACGGHVVCTGVGKSGLIARKLAATFSSTGTPAGFLHPVEAAHGDLGMVRAGDCVLALSNSGSTGELTAILPELTARGATLIALTGRADSALGRAADVVVPVAVRREACPMNLAPTCSTTAQLAVGDALAVCLMERKGVGEDDFRRCHPGGALGQRLAMRVADMMRTADLPLVSANATLAEGLAVLDKGGYGLVVAVGPDGTLAGVLSDGDVRRLAATAELALARPLVEVLTTAPRTVNPDVQAAEAMDVMEAVQITVLPVVDGGRPVGLLHLHDLLGKGTITFS